LLLDRNTNAMLTQSTNAAQSLLEVDGMRDWRMALIRHSFVDPLRDDSETSSASTNGSLHGAI
jgi:hypothetical protein